jgi:hypothetical protein
MTFIACDSSLTKPKDQALLPSLATVPNCLLFWLIQFELFEAVWCPDHRSNLTFITCDQLKQGSDALTILGHST